MKNLNRNVKTGLAVSLSIAIICAIMIPLVVKFAAGDVKTSSNASLGGPTKETNSENTNDGAEGENMIPIEPCPCFEAGDLEDAVNDLIGPAGSTYMFDKIGTCTGNDATGILYSSIVQGDFVEALGYSVSPQENECTQQDVIMMITDSEAITCKALIEVTCSVHEKALDDIGNIPTEICPCFDASELEDAVVDLTGKFKADFTFEEFSTCTGEAEDGIHYSSKTSGGGFPIPLGYGVDAQSNECARHDAFMMITETEADVCKQLIDATCSEHKRALDLLRGSVDECLCFTEEQVNTLVNEVNDGVITLKSNSCSGDASSKTISWNLDSGSPFPEFMAYGTSLFMDDSYCQIHDMLRSVTEEERIACEVLIDSACSQLNL